MEFLSLQFKTASALISYNKFGGNWDKTAFFILHLEKLEFTENKWWKWETSVNHRLSSDRTLEVVPPFLQLRRLSNIAGIKRCSWVLGVCFNETPLVSIAADNNSNGNSVCWMPSIQQAMLNSFSICSSCPLVLISKLRGIIYTIFPCKEIEAR